MRAFFAPARIFQLAAYEKRLADIDEECAAKLKHIEVLLRGATSAGLAHVFDDRRKTFLAPHSRWQWIFVGSVLLIVALAVWGLCDIHNLATAPTYDDLFLLWLARLPIAGALVWLTLHASRESALSKRLERDYGYKAAIATCFEGFKKQVVELAKEDQAGTALGKLCDNTLSTIASPPGRIYDKHGLVVSPADEIKELANVAAKSVKK